MTPTRLRRLLRDREDARELADLDPPELAVALEVLAEADPSDRALERLTLEAQAWADLEDTALRGTGLRLGRVVRWDDWTVTCEAVDVVSGHDVLARVLRPHARTPAHRRRLSRTARALAAALPGPYEERSGADPAVCAPLPGGPLVEGAPPDVAVGLRAALRIAADLEARERAGLGTVDPDENELRQAPEGARLVCLQLSADPVRLDDLVGRLFHVLPDGPLDAVLDGAVELPPASMAELAPALLGALAQELASARHGVVTRWKSRRHAHDLARLRALVDRLSGFPPPAGRGAVGVDMEGRTTVLVGDGRTLSWGPVDGPSLAIVSEQGLHPRTARRLLRARSDAPPSARLNALVDGDIAYAEHACRWVAAALSLRTVRLLLAVPT